MKRLIILLLIILSPTIVAQEKVYQIEMIVFSQPAPSNHKMEEWSTPTPSDFNVLRSGQIRPILASKFLLKNEQTKLNENPGYLTLLHLAWQQSITNLPARPVCIDGYRVLGLFRVNVQRYFNISLSFLFNKENGSDSWYVSQEFRMRSNQLNYLDFLYYGILIKIIPLT